MMMRPPRAGWRAVLALLLALFVATPVVTAPAPAQASTAAIVAAVMEVLNALINVRGDLGDILGSIGDVIDSIFSVFGDLENFFKESTDDETSRVVSAAMQAAKGIAAGIKNIEQAKLAHEQQSQVNSQIVDTRLARPINQAPACFTFVAINNQIATAAVARDFVNAMDNWCGGQLTGRKGHSTAFGEIEGMRTTICQMCQSGHLPEHWKPMCGRQCPYRSTGRSIPTIQRAILAKNAIINKEQFFDALAACTSMLPVTVPVIKNQAAQTTQNASVGMQADQAARALCTAFSACMTMVAYRLDWNVLAQVNLDNGQAKQYACQYMNSFQATFKALECTDKPCAGRACCSKREIDNYITRQMGTCTGLLKAAGANRGNSEAFNQLRFAAEQAIEADARQLAEYEASIAAAAALRAPVSGPASPPVQ